MKSFVVSLISMASVSSLLVPGSALAFTQQQGTINPSVSCTNAHSRRNFLSTGAAVGFAALIANPLPSVADVSDGNSLPQGALQFSRMLKTREQLKSVAARVAEFGSEIEKDEWDKIDQFLRTVYSAGEDMKVVAKGIYEPAKKTKADEDIKLLQKLAQAGQGPVSKRDAAGFAVVAKKADDLFEDFLDLLRDIPEDL